MTNTFAIPLVIAFLTMVGLLAALLGEGWPDRIAWVGLSVPVLVTVWPRERRRGRPPAD